MERLEVSRTRNDKIDVQVVIKLSNIATRSIRISRESKRDETESTSSFQRRLQCGIVPDVQDSADVTELGGFQSDAMQGNPSLK